MSEYFEGQLRFKEEEQLSKLSNEDLYAELYRLHKNYFGLTKRAQKVINDLATGIFKPTTEELLDDASVLGLAANVINNYRVNLEGEIAKRLGLSPSKQKEIRLKVIGEDTFY